MRIGRTILFLAALLLALNACQEADETPPKPVIRPVVTVTVKSPVEGREHRFSGMAKAPIETKLSFRVGGTVDSLKVCVGDQVKAGDLIAQLDPTDYKLGVQQLKAELARVQAGLQKAESDYSRYKRLYEKGNIAKSDLDAALATYESNKALRTSTAKSLELARKQLEYTTLHAPLDGHIAAVPVEAHQTVQAGTVIAVLTAGNLIEMDVGVPEQFIGQIKAGDSATIVFDAMSGREYKAEVTEIGVQAMDTSTFPVTIKLVEPDPDVRPGMVGLATFFFEASQGDKRVLVPAAAVVGGINRENYVWVYDANSETVKRCPVQVGNLTSYGLQIKDGLAPGDIVVVRGVHCLEEGLQVRLQDCP